MSEVLEGNGYLFEENHLVAPVRYRLRWSTDEWGRTAAEGELWVRSKGRMGKGEKRFIMHTEAGFSVPVEVTASRAKGWLPFRRVARTEVPGAMTQSGGGREAAHEVG
jgi:hypothetical protein